MSTKRYVPSTVKRLQRLAFKGCCDPGFGGCMPKCPGCIARDKLKATGQLHEQPKRPDWVFAEK